MASRGGRVRELKGRVRPQGQSVSGELGLVQAFLMQLIADALSDNAEWRREAWAFLNDHQACRFWCSLADLDDVAFLERVRRLRPG